jgi:predicted DNA-binding antitoxin AbrB/MazE fold protein
MEVVVEAIYEKGVLRPLKPLKLREGEKVKLKIVSKGITEFIMSLEDELQVPEKDPLEILREERERL